MKPIVRPPAVVDGHVNPCVLDEKVHDDGTTVGVACAEGTPSIARVLASDDASAPDICANTDVRSSELLELGGVVGESEPHPALSVASPIAATAAVVRSVVRRKSFGKETS